MHSNRMPTVRLLPVSPSSRGIPGPRGGVYLAPGGVPGLGRCTWSRGGWSWGMYLVPRGCTWPWGVTNPGDYLVPRGCAPGLSQQGCTWSRGGVPGPRGYLVLGGSCLGTPPCEQNDRQVQKYYLAPNFVCVR